VSREQDRLVVRDVEYMTWRFKRCPNRRYVILGATRGSALAGYIVLREETRDNTRVGVVVDFLTRPGDHATLRALVSAAMQRVKTRGADKVECVIASTRNDIGRALQRGGLTVRRPMRQWVTNQGGPMQNRVRDEGHWFITQADSDTDVT